MSLNILLIYPRYIHSDPCDTRSVSLSLLYLASRLQKDGHHVEIFDASDGPIKKTDRGYVYGMSDDDVLSRIFNKRFDLIGITCSFSSRWPFVKSLAKSIKSTFPSAFIVIGALYPTYNWQDCLNESNAIDAIILGEGEETFAHLVNNYEKTKNISRSCFNLSGVAFRKDSGVMINPKDKYIDDLDSLPYPAWDLIDLRRYFRFQKSFYNLRPPYFTVLSSRGCPEACTFCNMFITHGRKWRPRSPKKFVDEIEYLAYKYKVNNFFIADDNFSFDLNRAKEICKEIINRKLSINYNIGNGLSIKRIDKELLILMKQSGCGAVALAIESGSERIRNEVYKKRLPISSIYQAVRWCNEINIPVIGFFMVGAPTEDYKSIQQTKDLIKELDLTLCTCSIFTPYPGTVLYDDCRNKGYICKNSKQLDFSTPLFVGEGFNEDDVKRWQRDVYMTFIKHHWANIIKELFKTNGIVTFKDLLRVKKLF